MADPTSERVPVPENFTDDDCAEVLFNVSVKPPRAIVSEVFAPRPATVVGDEVNVTVRLEPPNVTTSVAPGGVAAHPVHTEALQFPDDVSAHAAAAGVGTKAASAENIIIARLATAATESARHLKPDREGTDVP